MKLDSAQDLKEQLLQDVVAPFVLHANKVRSAGAGAFARYLRERRTPVQAAPFGMGARAIDTMPQVQRSVALGVAPYRRGYRLAVRVQRPGLRNSPMVEHFTKEARGEVDIKLVGRIDKRAIAAIELPWYRRNTRPLLIGASIGHVNVTAGTIGAFVKRGSTVYILSNNHVLANEDHATAGDWIIQRGRFDGGNHPGDAVARVRHWVRFKKTGVNVVDAALAAVEPGLHYEATLLRGLVGGRNRQLAGLGPEFIDEGSVVYKTGRTTGASRGRVSAFDLDNLVVNYDMGNLRFDNQIEIEGIGARPFSDGGDSGALIVNDAMQAVGLLFAGSENGGGNNLGLTFANPIHRVLKDLKATLLP
jgi:hypothetical protein